MPAPEPPITLGRFAVPQKMRPPKVNLNKAAQNIVQIPRPTLSHLTLNAIVATYILAVLNSGYWAQFLKAFGQVPVSLAAFIVASWALTLFFLELLGPTRLQKPMAAILIMIAASADFYRRNFGVLIDREMIRNILETTVTESKHLITFDMVWQIGLMGALPAALVFWPKVKRWPILHQLWRWPVAVAASLALMIGALLVDFKSFSATFRDNKLVMANYQPGATLHALVRYTSDQWKSADPVAQPYGTDAAPGPSLAAATKPVLLVLFAGETARAQNFGLNGYARQTTPELAQRDVINFGNAWSCGTSTAVSIPCMFSHLSQAQYSREGFLSSENLLDILARSGFDVQWWDNNTGDQQVAKRLGFKRVDATLDAESCKGECRDTAFLPLIEKTAATMTRNTVLVLHMIGSHGPAYYLRYADERRIFTPDCTTTQFADCTAEAVVNAYDNSIVETDFVVANAIDILNRSDRVLPAVLYMSDHGESLGENGLYLHAAPMFMAPDEQRRVPMVAWLGNGFSQTLGIDVACLSNQHDDKISHDNLFHTVLGLLDVKTEVKNDALDLTAACKTQTASN